MKSILFLGKFLLGRGLLDSFGAYSKALGKRKIDDSFEGAGMTAEYILLGSECSRNEINRLAAFGKEKGCDCVARVGGGKLLDAAKSAAHAMKTPVIVAPTIASTDAPCSALSVIYTDDDVFEEYEWLPANPDIVMVDSLGV